MDREGEREREGKSKQDLNWHGIVALLPDQQNSFQGLILHAAPYPHKSYKIQRLAHGSGISSERKITFSSGIRCNSVAREGDREVGNILSRDTAGIEELVKGALWEARSLGSRSLSRRMVDVCGVIPSG